MILRRLPGLQILTMMILDLITKGKKPRPKTQAEIEEEKFISAVNALKTLQAPPGGCISIDLEELREVIIASREQCKGLVRRNGG
ncbi:hypothetical protein [Pseudomonas sp. XWY-1]|uniref:hypothetical protein n=1 Tax=Pseudomonas sp. XWY-1 TaxID=2069256 RepID=UPI0021151A28|nr:hypothetical protein [Pseudomonas sp. XWY-1]